MEFSYYFHYCKNLKFEDRPDYATLKYLFYDLLVQQENISNYTEFTYDWYEDAKDENEDFMGTANAGNMTATGTKDQLLSLNNRSGNTNQVKNK